MALRSISSESATAYEGRSWLRLRAKSAGFFGVGPALTLFLLLIASVSLSAPAKADDNVDVLVVYTENAFKHYRKQNLHVQGEVDRYAEWFNAALENHNIDGRMNVLHVKPTKLSETIIVEGILSGDEDNLRMLQHITASFSAAKQSVIRTDYDNVGRLDPKNPSDAGKYTTNQIRRIFNLRDEYQADLVVVIALARRSGEATCGIGQIDLEQESLQTVMREDNAYAVLLVGPPCEDPDPAPTVDARTYYASRFAHEVGHLFGLQHDRDSLRRENAYYPAYDKLSNFGWSIPGQFWSIMAYRQSCARGVSTDEAMGCRPAQYFSSPDIQLRVSTAETQIRNGHPVLVDSFKLEPLGAANADNAGMLRTRWKRVAGYRTGLPDHSELRKRSASVSLSEPVDPTRYDSSQSFVMTTMWTDPDGLCFEGGDPYRLNDPRGGAGMTFCAETDAQLWRLKPVGGGYFQLQSLEGEGKSLCLEGNGAQPSNYMGGAAFMAACGDFSGQFWSLTQANGQYFHLQAAGFANDNTCLEGNRPDAGQPFAGAAFKTPCADYSGQLWKFVPR